MKKQFLTLLVAWCLLPTAILAAADGPEDDARVVVGLDYHYNHEIRNGEQFHYTWEDAQPSGYSMLGELVRGLGAKTIAIRTPASQQALSGVDIYVIVDPDTPQETSNPNYIRDDQIEAIVAWVKRGGALVLLGNNEEQAEFEHFNKLAGRFGITFNEDTRKDSMDPKKLAMDSFPHHPLFRDVEKLYIRGMCTLTLKPPAEEIYNFRGDNIIAVCRYGKGIVFALGDPWCYNEYMDHADNRRLATNLFRWLIESKRKATP